MSEFTPTARGRAWAEHIVRIQMNARKTHQHAQGAEHCPTCSDPGDYRRCGEPTCSVCG